MSFRLKLSYYITVIRFNKIEEKSERNSVLLENKEDMYCRPNIPRIACHIGPHRK